MEREDVKSILESLLLVADGPQSVQRFSEVLDGTNKDIIESTLRELQNEFETENRGIRLVEVAGGYQLRTLRQMPTGSKNSWVAGRHEWEKRRSKLWQSSPTASPSPERKSKRFAASTSTA